MTDLDDLLAAEPIAAPSLTGAEGVKKCRRHQWAFMPALPVEASYWRCVRCHIVKDEARSRRARNNGKRGRAIQAQRIVALGGRNLAGNNPGWDGTSALFSFESKSGPSFFSERHWRVLHAIPKQGQQAGVLIVTDTPGPGHKARSYVVVEYDDWLALHGTAPTHE